MQTSRFVRRTKACVRREKNARRGDGAGAVIRRGRERRAHGTWLCWYRCCTFSFSPCIPGFGCAAPPCGACVPTIFPARNALYPTLALEKLVVRGLPNEPWRWDRTEPAEPLMSGRGARGDAPAPDGQRLSGSSGRDDGRALSARYYNICSGARVCPLLQPGRWCARKRVRAAARQQQRPICSIGAHLWYTSREVHTETHCVHGPGYSLSASPSLPPRHPSLETSATPHAHTHFHTVRRLA